jgi:hypothetical protein
MQNAARKGLPYSIPAVGDPIGHHAKNVQLELFGHAIQYFEQFAGFRPAAFRAGCFAGSLTMLQCLHEVGIRIDSSYNPCYHPELSFPDARLEPNLAQRIHNVWEIPVTVARTKLPEGHNGFKFADCTALSFAELRVMLGDAAAAGHEHFIVVFHSFSAVKPRDETYAALRPNRIVIRRLERLCRFLSEHPSRFAVDTLGSLARRIDLSPPSSGAHPVPELPLARSAVRKAVQLANNFYWL